MASNRVRLPVEDLVAGTTVSSGIFDEAGSLLINQDVTLTAEILESLHRRGIKFVEVRPDSFKTGRQKQRRVSSHRPPQRSPFDPVRKRRCNRIGQQYSRQRIRSFSKTIADSVKLVTRSSKVSVDPDRDINRLSALPVRLIDMVLEDQDLSAVCTARRWSDIDFASRSIQRCTLTIATAVEMGMNEWETVQAGQTSLLHDYGLLHQPAKFREPAAFLTEEESWSFRKHPAATVNLLASHAAVPRIVLSSVGQVHERIDGSGYPLGLRGIRISPFARVVGTVDAFLTLVHPGPGRPAVPPHDAMRFLRHMAHSGAFDVDAVESLVRCLSLYPIGSDVVLENGSRGMVVRQAGDNIDQPTVQLYESEDEPLVVLHERKRQIAEPICQPASRFMRITDDMMDELSWELFDPEPGYVRPA